MTIVKRIKLKLMFNEEISKIKKRNIKKNE